LPRFTDAQAGVAADEPSAHDLVRWPAGLEQPCRASIGHSPCRTWVGDPEVRFAQVWPVSQEGGPLRVRDAHAGLHLGIVASAARWCSPPCWAGGRMTAELAVVLEAPLSWWWRSWCRCRVGFCPESPIYWVQFCACAARATRTSVPRKAQHSG